DGAFSAGDLMMVHTLLRLKPSGMLAEYPRLAAYVARGEARPTYKRAFAAQLAVFTGKHAADASAHPCQAAIQLPSPPGELAVETQRAQLPAGFPQGVQAATGGEGSRRYSGGTQLFLVAVVIPLR